MPTGRMAYPMILFSCLVHICSGYKILIYPSNVKSRIITSAELGAALVQNKHEVHMLVPSNTQPPSSINKEITLISYPSSTAEPVSESEKVGFLLIQGIQAKGFIDWVNPAKEVLNAFQTEVNDDCENIISNLELYDRLDKANYDLVIYEPFEISCTSALVYKLGLPGVLMSFPFNQWFYRVPVLPSIVPGIMMDTTNVMTFYERLKSLCSEIFFYLVPLQQSMEYMQKYVPEKELKQPYEVIQEARLWFQRKI